jgi:hypothetical protein
MQARNPRLVLMSMATAAICGVLAVTPTQAADPACKGLEQTKCATTDGCAWTDEYTRKDGKTVAGYCHKIGKQGAVAKDKAPEQALPAAKVPPAGKAPELTPPPVKAPATTGTGTTPPPASKSP